MITKLLGWLSLVCAVAIAGGPLAGAQEQQVGETEDDFYEHYEGGFDEQADEDDWFYDYYSYAAEPEGVDPYASYDADADLFDWEEDGLFA